MRQRNFNHTRIADQLLSTEDRVQPQRGFLQVLVNLMQRLADEVELRMFELEQEALWNSQTGALEKLIESRFPGVTCTIENNVVLDAQLVWGYDDAAAQSNNGNNYFAHPTANAVTIIGRGSLAGYNMLVRLSNFDGSDLPIRQLLNQYKGYWAVEEVLIE